MPSGVILGTIQMLEVILRLAIVTCRCRFGDFALTDAVVTSIVFVVAVAAEIVCQPHPDDESTFIGNSAPGGSSAGKTALLAAQLIGNLTRLLMWLNSIVEKLNCKVAHLITVKPRHNESENNKNPPKMDVKS